MVNRIAVLLLASFVLVACNNEAMQFSLIDGFDNPSSVKECPMKHASFIPLSDDIVIDVVKQIIISNDAIIVGANNGVFEFDKNGNFLMELSQKGKAQREWITMDAISFNEEDSTIDIFDTSSKKVLRYSTDGTFLSSDPIPDHLFTIYTAQCLPCGDMVFSHGIINNSEVLYSIASPENDFKFSFKYCTEMKTSGSCEKVGKHPVSAYDGRVLFVSPFDNVVYEMNNGKAQKRFEIKTSKKVLSKKKKRAMSNFSIGGYLETISQGYFSGVNNIFETEDFITMSFFDETFIVFGKKNNTYTCFSPHKDPILEGMPPIGLIDCNGSSLIGCIDAITAMNYRSMIPDSTRNDCLLQLRAISERPLSSNPVIAIYQY